MQKETEKAPLKELEQMFNSQDDIELAILIGSRAKVMQQRKVIGI